MESKLLTGTVEMLMLEVISQSPSYGYQIVQEVAGKSKGYFELKEGSLYPALHRLERQKMLASFWEQADGRRRKYYKITASGAKALQKKRQEWLHFSNSVNGVLGATCAMA